MSTPLNLFVLPSTAFNSQDASACYVLAPASLADPELLISQSIHEAFMANPHYAWSQLADILMVKGFILPEGVYVSEKRWDSPQSTLDDAFFVEVPSTAEHEYAGKRLDVLTSVGGEFGEAMLCDARGQVLYSNDQVRKLDADHEIGDVFHQVPLGQLVLPLKQFGPDMKAAERAKQLLTAAAFDFVTE